MEFSERLKKKRRENNMTQTQLANASGLTLRTIQYYENGERRPKNHEIVEKLAEALGTTSGMLLGKSDEYILAAQEKGGTKAANDMEEMVNGVIGMFAGGTMDDESLDGVYRALTEAYWIAKDKNKKYTPKKYRKDTEE